MTISRQEFIVTLKDRNFLDQFYQDMELESNKAFIPNRAVTCVNRRPLSRNTSYLLTREEVRELRKDSRVELIELIHKSNLLKTQAHAAQTALWSRGTVISEGQKNWGLYRSMLESKVSGWGSESLENSDYTATVKFDATGKNVDIIIVDEIIYPDHPEFGDRVVPYDWFGQHDEEVKGAGCLLSKVERSGSNIATVTTQLAHNLNIGAVVNVVCISDNSFDAVGVTVTNVSVTTIGDGGDGITINKFSYANTGDSVASTDAEGYYRGVYQYDSFSYSNNHATHVGAIIGGDTQGWAREANLYNLRHDALNAAAGEYTPSSLLVDYIRAFHNNKSINPETGRKNPTIVNNSWGFGIDLFGERNQYTGGLNYSFSRVNYQGEELRPVGDPVDTGISGIYTASAKMADLNSVVPETANLIETTDTSAGTVTSITYNPNGRTGLNQETIAGFDPGQYSENDEAYWEINLPFNITYCTQSYNKVYVNSNSYVTFGGGSFAYLLGAGAPNIRKIFVSAADRSCEGVWSGTIGTTPNRTHVIRWEGYEGSYGTTYETVPTVIWEMVFSEANPAQIELHIVENANYRAEFSDLNLIGYGINVTIEPSPLRDTTIDADITDAIADGIIFVGSAGNNDLKIDVEGGDDYNNFLVSNGRPIYYNQGSSPSSQTGVICVGSIDSASTETKAVSSNAGPRVDVYAPGENIISAVYDANGSINPTITEGGGMYQKLSGTSMACAQVTGMLALTLEKYPFMTPADAVKFITNFSKPTIVDTGGGYDDATSLQGSANRFAYYRKERSDNGVLVPKSVRYIRPETGAVFPRPLIKRT